jgi:ribosomal protein L22
MPCAQHAVGACSSVGAHISSLPFSGALPSRLAVNSERFRPGSQVRRVLDQIRGRTYEEALILLEYLPFRACEPVLDTLISVGLLLFPLGRRFVDLRCIGRAHGVVGWTIRLLIGFLGHHAGGCQRQEQPGHAQGQAVRQ